MGQKAQYVIIKGTKDGLTLHLNDQCSFDDLTTELGEKLTSNFQDQNDSQQVSVHIKVGNRFLNQDQEETIRTIIRSKKHLIIESIESNVMSKEEALALKKANEIVSVAKIIRSGQVLQVPGDLLLIGDVNPGGTIIAAGNIFILGTIKGIAHAGFYGDTNAVIAASVMKPSQLRIGNVISRSPDKSSEDGNEMECAFIDHEKQQIIIDRIQVLPHLRPSLNRLERGM